jgi:DNA-binding PadR family transcriptional regulator
MTRRHPPFGPGGAGQDSADFGHAAHWRGLFGRHRGGPFERWRGPRMFDSGALRLLVLGLIAEAPRHGYDIIRDLHDRFQGAYRPSPGSIYPILQMLAEAGLVTSEMHGRQRLFAVSDEGRAYLADQRAELAAINAQLDEASGPIGESAIGEAIQELRTALYEKLRKSALSAAQAAKLRAALERARREIEDI